MALKERFLGVIDHVVSQVVPHTIVPVSRKDGSWIELHYRGGQHLGIERADGTEQWADEKDIIHEHDSKGRLVRRQLFGELKPGDEVVYRGAVPK